jgi:hypothetical protein
MQTPLPNAAIDHVFSSFVFHFSYSNQFVRYLFEVGNSKFGAREPVLVDINDLAKEAAE